MDEVRRRLREMGATDEQIAEAVDLGNIGIASDLRLLDPATMTARELAASTGSTVDEVLDMYRLLGISVADPDERLFQDGEVELVGLIRAAVGENRFTDDEGNDILRVTANAFAQVAEAAVNEYAVGVEERARQAEADLLQLFENQVATAELGLLFASVTPYLFLHHIRVATVRQRQAMGASETRNLSRFAIGFIDLAGYTQRSARLGPAELSDFVRSFEVTAFEMAIDRGARIVKHIGDEVMFVATDPVAAAGLAQSLIGHFDADDVTARGGIAFGDVLSRRGDYHGPIVNLASRLTDEAVDGEVLVDANMQVALEGSVELEAAGRRKLKGFDEAIRVWSLA